MLERKACAGRAAVPHISGVRSTVTASRLNYYTATNATKLVGSIERIDCQIKRQLPACETGHPRVRTARPPNAGARNVKFSEFYVNCSAPSGARHQSPPRGPAMRMPEQQQSVLTILNAATPKGVSSPDYVASTSPGLKSGERGVEECVIEVFEHHPEANKISEVWRSARFSLPLGGVLV